MLNMITTASDQIIFVNFLKSLAANDVLLQIPIRYLIGQINVKVKCKYNFGFQIDNLSRYSIKLKLFHNT